MNSSRPREIIVESTLSKDDSIALIVCFSLLLLFNVILSILGTQVYERMKNILKKAQPDTPIPSKATQIRDAYFALLAVGILSAVTALVYAARGKRFPRTQTSQAVFVAASFILFGTVLAQGGIAHTMYYSLYNVMTTDTKNLVFYDSKTKDMYDTMRAFFWIAVVIITVALSGLFIASGAWQVLFMI